MIKFESEKHLEQFIIDCFNDDGHCIVTDEIYDECIPQFDTKSYGIPDLVFYSIDTDLDQFGKEFEIRRVHVVELKNEPIKLSHIAQISRYKTYFDRAYDGFEVEMQFSLVVPDGIENNDDCCWLINNLDGIEVYEYKLDPRKGIQFQMSSGWHKKESNKSYALGLFGFVDSEDKGF